MLQDSRKYILFKQEQLRPSCSRQCAGTAEDILALEFFGPDIVTGSGSISQAEASIVGAGIVVVYGSGSIDQEPGEISGAGVVTNKEIETVVPGRNVFRKTIKTVTGTCKVTIEIPIAIAHGFVVEAHKKAPDTLVENLFGAFQNIPQAPILPKKSEEKPIRLPQLVTSRTASVTSGDVKITSRGIVINKRRNSKEMMELLAMDVL